jgi:hypothetical protein
MKTKARIVKRTYRNDKILYVIQRKTMFFPWKDVLKSRGHRLGSPLCFGTLEEAQEILRQLDKPYCKDEVVWP